MYDTACVSTAFVGVATAFAAKTLPLLCVSTAFAAETVPLPAAHRWVAAQDLTDDDERGRLEASPASRGTAIHAPHYLRRRNGLRKKGCGSSNSRVFAAAMAASVRTGLAAGFGLQAGLLPPCVLFNRPTRSWLLGGESWLTAAITMGSSYCSCKRTRVPVPRGRAGRPRPAGADALMRWLPALGEECRGCRAGCVMPWRRPLRPAGE